MRQTYHYVRNSTLFAEIAKRQGQASLWFLVSCGILHTLSHSVFCDQHHSEPCFALHHASVSIISLLERNCLDHRADILQNAEGKRVLAINRRASQAPIDRA